MSKLFSVALLAMFMLSANTALAGSVWVNNYLNEDIEVCRGGGHAGCWKILPCSRRGPDYVQTDRPFQLKRPVESRTFSVTAENEQYEVFLDFDEKVQMRFCPGGCAPFDPNNCETRSRAEAADAESDFTEEAEDSDFMVEVDQE